MALVGINQPNVGRPERKRSVLEQIADGVQIATNVLGAGFKAYETFGPEADLKKAHTDLYKAQAASAPEDKALDRDLKKSQIQYYGQSKPLELEKTQREVGKLREEEQYGRKLTENTVQELSAASVLPNELSSLSEVIDKNKDLFGPVEGRARGINPYDESAKTVNAKLKAVAQSVGKYMEGGVLRKEDVAKYEAMLPSLGDTYDVAKNKAAIVQKMLSDKFKADYRNLKSSGYDVRAFEQNPLSSMALPSILTPSEEMISVVSPEGIPGRIPASKIDQALQRGFKRQ